MVGIYDKYTKKADDYRGFSYPNYADLRDGARAFGGVATGGP